MIYRITLGPSLGLIFTDIDVLIRDLPHYLTAGTEDLADEAVARMQAQHNRDAHEIERYVNRTWNLTNSTTQTTVYDHLSGKLQTTFKADTDYAEAVEFGTPTSRPYPFFWIEVHRFEQEAVQRASESLFFVLERHEGYVRSRT